MHLLNCLYMLYIRVLAQHHSISTLYVIVWEGRHMSTFVRLCLERHKEVLGVSSVVYQNTQKCKTVVATSYFHFDFT